MNNQDFGGGPDTTNNREAYYPGFPVQANQTSTRRATSGSLRSTLGNTMVNEFRIGYGGAPVDFCRGRVHPGSLEWPGCEPGWLLPELREFHGLHHEPQNYMNAGPAGTTSSRDAHHMLLEDSLNWLKGSHSITVGGNYSNYQFWANGQQIVPELRFDVVHRRSGRADVQQRRELPGGVGNGHHTGEKALCHSDRPRQQRARYRATGRSHRRIRVSRTGRPARTPAADRVVAGRFVAHALELHAQLRRRGTTSPSRSSPRTTAIRSAIWRMCSASRGVGNLFKPGTLDGETIPSSISSRKANASTRWTGTTLRRASASRGSPTAGGAKMHRLLGQSGDLSVRGGYSRSFTRLGLADFTNETST